MKIKASGIVYATKVWYSIYNSNKNKKLKTSTQNNCLNIVHTVITLLTQGYTENVPWRSPKGPNVRDLHEIFKGLSGDQY